ncbi:nucleoside deaminase [Bacillus piscicola]|uniref:nucleoside deaminase n=1 Tax=Bacillus piscicola TaxID=1632684 RepID=UPI001F08BA91|nr:nucleoside deaminase [Bacillus piscicola]
MDKFMKRAVELAIANVKDGGQPFGAVLVKNDTVVAEGVNELHIKNDISGHAELIAIRKAQDALQTIDLSGYVMYASGEPCPMCMTAIYYSGIQHVFFAESIVDAEKAGLTASKQIYEDLAKNRSERTITVEQIPVEPGSTSPLSLLSKR